MHSTYVRMARQRAEQRQKRGQHGRRTALALKAKMKDCCRKLTAFFFTQIGVCGLIVSYTIIGAFMFIALEADTKHPSLAEVVRQRRSCVEYLWNITHHLNVLNQDQWRRDVSRTVYEYQTQLVRHIRRGYDGTDDVELGARLRWTVPSALMYCITIYTTIGYGNLTPRTDWGKLATIFYALVGIPLMLLYMANVGDILAKSFKYTYNKICKCPKRKRRTTETAVSTVVVEGTTALSEEKGAPGIGNSKKSPRSAKDNRKKQLSDSVPQEKTVEANRALVAQRETSVPFEPLTVSVTSCLLVIFLFVFGGAILFSIWEDWGYVDGSYFCFTSLLTIGFGDLVPGTTIYNTLDGQSQNAIDSKLILCAIYLLLGMALLAMCFNLMQEEVFMKIKRFGRRLGLLRERFAN